MASFRRQVFLIPVLVIAMSMLISAQDNWKTFGGPTDGEFFTSLISGSSGDLYFYDGKNSAVLYHSSNDGGSWRSTKTIFNLDAGKIPPGNYRYRVQAGSEVASGGLTVVK